MAINYKICPYCNSKDVAKIVYGYPSGDMIMQEAVGKIKLGGCIITGIDPEYFCNNCEREWDKEEAIEHAYEKIKEIKISIGGYHQGFQELHINLENGKVFYEFSLKEEEKLSTTLSPELLEVFKQDLIEINILNWKRRYDDNDILDGTQWEIVLVRDGRNIIRSGSNDYPKEWENFCKIISDVSGRALARKNIIGR